MTGSREKRFVRYVPERLAECRITRRKRPPPGAPAIAADALAFLSQNRTYSARYTPVYHYQPDSVRYLRS